MEMECSIKTMTENNVLNYHINIYVT